jgi:hypothetical protein
VKVTAPDGTRWHVGRQWWPERGRDLDPGAVDGVDGSGFGDLFDLGDASDFLAVLAVIAFALILILFVTTVLIPLIAFTIELIVVIVLFFAGLAGRLLFRRPWTVRARTGGRTYHRWHVVGFRNSGQRRDEVAAALGSGRALPPG